MQAAEQERKNGNHGNPAWTKGVSQNPKGKESKAARLARREAIIAAWCEPHGGVATLKPAELELVRQAAELSMCRPRNVVERVRYANTISRIMTQVGLAAGFTGRRRPRSQPQPASPFDALLGRRERA